MASFTASSSLPSDRGISVGPCSCITQTKKDSSCPRCTAPDFLDTVIAILDLTSGSRRSEIVAPGPTVCVECSRPPVGLPDSLMHLRHHAAVGIAMRSQRTWAGERKPWRSTSHCSLYVTS